MDVVVGAVGAILEGVGCCCWKCNYCLRCVEELSCKLSERFSGISSGVGLVVVIV